MTSKTHQFFGLALTGTIYLSINLSLTNETLLLGALATSLGSLTPDIDKPGSYLWRKLPGGTIIDNFITPFFGGHRNISHSLLGLLIFGTISLLLLNLIPLDVEVNIVTVWIAYLIGFLSHLIADSFTVTGCPWLYPLPNYFGFPPKPFHGLRVVTGKWFENLIIFPVLCLWFAYVLHQILTNLPE